MTTTATMKCSTAGLVHGQVVTVVDASMPPFVDVRDLSGAMHLVMTGDLEIQEED